MNALTIKLPGAPKAVRVTQRPAGLASAAGDDADKLHQQLQAQQRMLEAERTALARARQALEKASAELARMREQVLAEAQTQVVDLGIEIARKVLMQEIKAQRHEVDPIVKEALARAPQRQDLVVHLNAADLARCELAQGDAAGGGVQFVADPALSPGSCRVESRQGVVESSIESHLAEIAQALKDG